jgi:outer membrane immunogenic protein
MAGGLLGFATQSGALVLGGEADFNLGNLSGSFGPNLEGLTADSTVDSHVNWLGTLRGRFGYAAGNVLFYGTGGLAIAGISDHLSDFDGLGSAASASSVAAGWTAGAGVAFKISDHLSVKAEDLYVRLNKPDATFDDSSGNAAASSAGSATAFNLVRLGLNYSY